MLKILLLSELVLLLDTSVHVLILKGCAIHYVETVIYLGVHIRCGKYFRLSTEESKGDFYRAVNALCSKTKYKLDDMVMLHLVTSFCRPLLVYGAECIKFTPRYDNAVKSSWNYVFWRIFRVSDSLADDMSQFTGTSTITSFVLQQRIKFRQKMSCSLIMSVRFYMICLECENFQNCSLSVHVNIVRVCSYVVFLICACSCFFFLFLVSVSS